METGRNFNCENCESKVFLDDLITFIKKLDDTEIEYDIHGGKILCKKCWYELGKLKLVTKEAKPMITEQSDLIRCALCGKNNFADDMDNSEELRKFMSGKGCPLCQFGKALTSVDLDIKSLKINTANHDEDIRNLSYSTSEK